ncbi:MAG: 23S rRNA (adenine(2503)-C(2))-methyltransferase RlmN [Ruminococcaceae bacterium]|nr:23S rRNA (adenine(2503)-C(2))-methyltransferase RlmN [Oscillospiraceae bacterium]
MKNKTDIKSLNLCELEAAFTQMALPRFRASQVYRWLQVQGVTYFDEMTNVSLQLREQLAAAYFIPSAQIERKLVSQIDGTVKYLFSLYDGQTVESVVMQYKYGYTICVSTQVGCRMGCRFCASTLNGCIRNLAASEILSQIHAAQRDLSIRISHVVLMGMGEPLDNFENVLRFLELVSDENGLNISARSISLSTCGIVPKIKELTKRKLQITLSVSLHAPNDAIRSTIMPVNRKWGVDTLLAACREYASVTGRRISFEYTMIDGVNDSDACARELGKKLRGMLAHVNLIPVNLVKENTFHKSDKVHIERFIEVLKEYGVTATVRRTLGADINASCGQLRQSAKQAEQKEVSN